MEAERIDEIEIDIRDLLFTLWQRKLIIILVGIATAAAAYAYTYFFVTPMYESTTSIYVINRQQQDQITNADLSASTTLTADLQALITSRNVLESVIDKLSLNVSVSDLAGRISVTNKEKTRILKVTVKDERPQRAKEIADELSMLASTQVVEILGTEQLTVYEEGSLSDSPASPNMKKNILLGGAAGVFLTIAVILLIYFLDDTIRTVEDIENFLKVSVLGAIPVGKSEINATGRKKKKKKIARAD